MIANKANRANSSNWALNTHKKETTICFRFVRKKQTIYAYVWWILNNVFVNQNSKNYSLIIYWFHCGKSKKPPKWTLTMPPIFGYLMQPNVRTRIYGPMEYNNVHCDPDGNAKRMLKVFKNTCSSQNAEGHVTWIPTLDIFYLCVIQIENNVGISMHVFRVLSSVLVVGPFMKWWLSQKEGKKFFSLPSTSRHTMLQAMYA